MPFLKNDWKKEKELNQNKKNKKEREGRFLKKIKNKARTKREWDPNLDIFY